VSFVALCVLRFVTGMASASFHTTVPCASPSHVSCYVGAYFRRLLRYCALCCTPSLLLLPCCLLQIPTQVLEYMKQNGIKPKPQRV
jgi:hypothetical protein